MSSPPSDPRPDNLWASSDEPWSQPLPSPGLFVSAGEEVSASESFGLGLPPALGEASLGEAPLSAPPKAAGASRAWATARKVLSHSGGERRRSFLQQVVTQIQQPRKTGVVGRLVLKTSLGAAYVDEERYEDVQLDSNGVLELPGLGEVIIAHGALELHFAEHVRGRAARHMRTYSLRHALGKGQTSLETADGALRVALTPHADGSTWLIRSVRIHDIAPLFGSPLRRVSVAADAETRDASPAAAAAVRRQSTLATGAAGSPSPLSKRGSVGGGASIWGSAREVSSREVASREHDGAEQSARERRAREIEEVSARQAAEAARRAGEAAARKAADAARDEAAAVAEVDVWAAAKAEARARASMRKSSMQYQGGGGAEASSKEGSPRRSPRRSSLESPRSPPPKRPAATAPVSAFERLGKLSDFLQPKAAEPPAAEAPPAPPAEPAPETAPPPEVTPPPPAVPAAVAEPSEEARHAAATRLQRMERGCRSRRKMRQRPVTPPRAATPPARVMAVPATTNVAAPTNIDTPSPPAAAARAARPAPVRRVLTGTRHAADGPQPNSTAAAQLEQKRLARQLRLARGAAGGGGGGGATPFQVVELGSRAAGVELKRVAVQKVSEFVGRLDPRGLAPELVALRPPVDAAAAPPPPHSARAAAPPPRSRGDAAALGGAKSSRGRLREAPAVATLGGQLTLAPTFRAATPLAAARGTPPPRTAFLGAEPEPIPLSPRVLLASRQVTRERRPAADGLAIGDFS